VASESQAPPNDEGGGNAKYVVLALLLFGGAAGVWFAMSSGGAPPPPPPPPVADAGARPAVDPNLDLEIPPELPDLGPPVDFGPPTKRIIYRYVGGGGWDCSGEITDAPSVMSQAQRQVRNCYERQLKSNNTLRGTVIVSLKVGGAGTVQAVQIGGTLRDNEVFTCVRNVMQALRFTVPSGGTCAVVQQPFNLTPQN
jgi:hypothetical protein